MSTEVIDLICQMNLKKIQSQLVLQCAPLIVGVKISNLFVTEPGSIRSLKRILDGSGISFYVLTNTPEKATCFLFRKNSMKKYLREKENLAFLNRLGYQKDLTLTEMMLKFRCRYAAYQRGEAEFPHEMGIFLGYPIEDVEGFIENDGQNYLYSGYWKVYKDVEKKKELFDLYEIAKETLVCILAGGVSIREIIETYCGGHSKLSAAV